MSALPQLRMQPVEKWVRAYVGDEPVVDTRRVPGVGAAPGGALLRRGLGDRPLRNALPPNSQLVPTTATLDQAVIGGCQPRRMEAWPVPNRTRDGVRKINRNLVWRSPPFSRI